MNGTLTPKNHEGGAMFTISLPQAWNQGRHERTGEVGCSVLYVEDDNATREEVTRFS